MPSRNFLTVSLLFVSVLAVYGRVAGFPFIEGYDDQIYIVENHQVRSGLTVPGILWAFTTFHAANWHPLTWLSHMTDVQLFGMNPSMHHLVNVLFHAANSALLFLVLSRITGSVGKSGFVAALFALHPLHVESVAWVAERKDVLSTFFLMLALWAYIRYVERPGTCRYLAVLGFFALGLLAKPMLVTFPFVLLLLDRWPLGRFADGPFQEIAPERFGRTDARALLREKIPLFVFSAGSCAVTFMAQRSGEAMIALDHVSIRTRMANAAVSYAGYVWKTLWPGSLAVFYPYSESALSVWTVGGSVLLLVCVTSVAVLQSGKRPWLAVGWFWYLGTLVPVIGLVQVGAQSMADRYTYVPLIGLFVAAAWTATDLLKEWRYRDQILYVMSVFILLVFAITAWIQAGYWRDTITLFEHAIDVTTGNWAAHNNIGVALTKQGRGDLAESRFRESLRLNPENARAQVNLGARLAEQGKTEEAIAHFREALRLRPNNSDAHNNLGVALRQQGKTGEAEVHFREAIRIRPADAIAHNSLGVTLAQEGKLDDAIVHFRDSIRVKPDYASAHYNIGLALVRKGMPGEAMMHFNEVLRIRPGDEKAIAQIKIVTGGGKP